MQMMTVAGGDVNKAVGIYFWGKNRSVIFSCETGTQRNMYIYTQAKVCIVGSIVVVPKYFLGSTLLLG